MPVQFGFCCKCGNVITKPTKPVKGVAGQEIIGCEELTKKEWHDGIVTEPFWQQSKCPLIGKEGK